MKNVYKLLGIIALIAIIGFSMIACGDGAGGGSGGGGGGGGSLTWDDWEAYQVSQGYTKGWPTTELTVLGITLAQPGGTPYWWDEAGDLRIDIGRANPANFDTLKDAIDNDGDWTFDDEDAGYYYYVYKNGVELRLNTVASEAGGIVICLGFTP